MARGIGRRALFFAVVVVLSLALYYPTPPEFRWVCLLTAALGGFWALLLGIEDLTAPTQPARPRGPHPPPVEPETPFAPPPAPGAPSA